LGKAFFNKSVKRLEVGKGCRTASEAKNGRVDLGTGIKNFGRQMTNFFDIEDGLKKDGDGTVLGSARDCRVTIGDLLLESDNNHLRRRRAESELHKERGRDGVGKISTDVGSGGMLGKGF
jgi:hypothetical protein